MKFVNILALYRTYCAIKIIDSRRDFIVAELWSSGKFLVLYLPLCVIKIITRAGKSLCLLSCCSSEIYISPSAQIRTEKFYYLS